MRRYLQLRPAESTRRIWAPAGKIKGECFQMLTSREWPRMEAAVGIEPTVQPFFLNDYKHLPTGLGTQ
jgi:hypothetical protein